MWKMLREAVLLCVVAYICVKGCSAAYYVMYEFAEAFTSLMERVIP
jgi:hypothetical protein